MDGRRSSSREPDRLAARADVAAQCGVDALKPKPAAWEFPVFGNFASLSFVADSSHPENMRLSDEALTEFRAIWRTEHPDETISDEELRDMATRVLRAIDAVYRAIPADIENDDRRPT